MGILLLFSTIKKWDAELKRGHTSLDDDPRKGHPKSAPPPEIIEQVLCYWMTGG
jgi:hypothetical protein